MKRPTINQFSKPFALDSKFVSVDRKQYAKELEIYIDHLENYKKYVKMMVDSNSMPSTFENWEKSLNFLK